MSYRYQYVTHTILNEAPDHLKFSTTTSDHHHHQQQQQQQSQTAARKDVGFKLSANVDITPVWTSNSGVMVVKLQVTLYHHYIVIIFYLVPLQ